MPSRGVLARGYVLALSVVLTWSSLMSGLTPVAPAAVGAAESPYPGFDGAFLRTTDLGNIRFAANAGVVNLAAHDASQPPNPDASSVTAVAGSSPLQGAALLTSDLHGTPLGSTTLDSLHLESLPIEIPLSTIPISRPSAPRTWEDLLNTTVLGGIPLANVTWKQADALTGAGRPAALDQITLDQVDWSGSALRDLPLAALTFGGKNVTAIDIPLQPGEPASDDTNAERWCHLLNQAQAGSCTSPGSLTGQSLIEIGVRGAPLKDIPLKDIPLKDIALAGSPLKDIPLKDIVLKISPLKDIPLKDIALAGSPLKDIPLKDIAWAISPLKDIPLKDIAWASTPLKDIPLKDIDLAGSPLKDIPLKDIDFSIAPLKDIPLKDIDFSIAPLKDIPLKDIALAGSPLKDIPLKDIAWGIAPLKDIPLKDILFTSAGVPTSSPLKDIPLKDIAQAGAPLKDIPLKDISFGVAPLKDIALKNIDLVAAGLDGMALDALSWTSAGLRTAPLSQFTFAGAPLGTIALASTANPAGIAGCAAAQPVTCTAGETLAQAAAAGDIRPTATLADIGSVGFAGHGTLHDLLAARIAGSTVDPRLGDLRLDLAGPTAPPVTIGALVLALQAAGATPAPNPTIDSLRADTMSALASLGDIRLDLIAGAPALTLGDLLASLSSNVPDVRLGDIRLDLVAGAPALTLAGFLATLSSSVPDVTLGDLRLDMATGVDALVLNAIAAFLLDPDTFAPYLLGALGTYTDATGHDIALGELGIWTDQTGADITLGQLAQYLDDSVTLADVLLGLVPPGAFPFEDFPVASLNLADHGRGVFPIFHFGSNDPAPPGLVINQSTYLGVKLINLHNDSSPTSPVDLEAILPAGASFTSVDLTIATDPVVPIISTDADGRTHVRIHYPSTEIGVIGVTTFLWENQLHTGPSEVSFNMLTPDGDLISSGGTFPVTIEDGAEPNTPQEGIIAEHTYAGSSTPQLPINPAGCSGSDATCAGKDRTYVDDLVPGFISYPGDSDYYEMRNVRAGSRITSDLTNLPLDADLVLYGPGGLDVSPSLFPTSDVGLPGQLVEDSELGVGRAARSIAAQALSDLHLDAGFLFPDDSVSLPMTPISVSQHRGNDAESVGTIAPVTGDYVVAVTGYNGTTSNDPYLLRTRVTTPPPEASCPARSFPNATPAAGALPTISPSANAIFLTDPGRLAATYGQSAADDVAAALATHIAYLQAHPELGVDPAVVPLDAYANVATAYAAWDADPCNVAAANEVAQRITKVLSDIHISNPGLAYITVVGGDDIIPMGRVPDLTRISNESQYASTFGGATNPISAAEAASYMLTDDVYGDPSPTPIGNGGNIFIPRIAVGRLVEKPTEIVGLLGEFGGTNHGTLDTSTGLVAGYDFLSDGANAAANRLNVGGRTVDSSLVDPPGTADPWTKADLLAKLFPPGGPTPLIDSINAHYDHTALLPSAGNAGGSASVLTAGELKLLSSGGQFANRVFFTIGCHAGLSVPDAYVPGAGADAAALRLDLPQTLAAAGVSAYVANSGFGIGDTSSIAYSERLLGLYAKLLDGSLTAGQAFAFAKQAYYGSLGAVGVYDLKILQQAAFYGLPYWHLTTAPGVTPAAPTPPALPGTITTDPGTGLQHLDLTLAQTFTAHSDGRGTYWTANGQDPQVTQYRPVQPKTTTSIVTPSATAHGVLITSLDSHEVADVDPVLDTPTVDLSGSSPEVSTDDAAWPARLAVVTNSQAPYGRAQDLVLLPGQFIGPSTDEAGRQRLYDHMGVSVLYAPNAETDFEAPTIASATGTANGSSIDFSVSASDIQGPVARVVVGYHDFDGTWKFVDLTKQGGLWSANAPTSHAFSDHDTVEFFAQAVDGGKNVGTASNKAFGFRALVPDDAPPSISADVTPAPNADGWLHGDAATVTFTCSDDGSGVAAGACPAPFLVTTEGVQLVSGSVSDRQGNTASAGAIVRLDRTDPSVTASVSPDGWTSAASVTVTFTCSDDLSGLDTAGCPVPVTVTAQGTTTVSRAVHDLAGNQASVDATVRIDRSAPTITASIAAAPNAAGWGHGTSATVTFSCSDSISGIPSGACPAPAVVSAEGVTNLARTTTDRAGNGAAVTATVRLDRTSPTVTVNGTPLHPACATSDTLAGVATNATLTLNTVRVNGIPTTTATCNGASDRAGNVGSASLTYVAPMNFSGFQSPVDNLPVVNSGNSGRTYPVKFSLKDAQGAYINVLPAVTSTTYQSVNCNTFSSTTDPLPTDTSGTSGLRVDGTGFVYNWKTPSAAGCYVLSIGLADGSTYKADFKLK